MKSILKIVLLLSYIWIAGTTSSFAQEKTSYIPEGKYLVIGTFRIKKNAIGFTNYVKSLNKYEVSMSYHPVKDYYYVYIKGYGPGEDGTADVNKMRRQTEFIDTWFMIVEPYEIPGQQTPVTSAKQGQQNTPGTGLQATDSPEATRGSASTSGSAWVQVSSGHAKANTDTASPAPVPTEPGETNEPDKVKSGWMKVSSTPSPAAVVDTKDGLIPKSYNQKGKYKLFFNTYYIKNYKEVKGPVEIINPASLKLLKVEKSLELVKVADPNNGKHAVQLIANIFGYKKVQQDINLAQPIDSINTEVYFKGDTLMVDFPLRRYEVGEIATMYNVYFFKDAVIMKPISKFELNTLVDMLKENDNLKIRIHGHTNGKAAGRILLMPEGSEDYFSLNQNIVEDRGSAKELSVQRAEVIKRYLMSYGISADRMEIKGWGGKKPLYDKLDKLAIKNVRVEIEILEN